MSPTSYDQVFHFTFYSVGPDGRDREELISIRMGDYQLNQIEEHLLAAALLQERTSYSDNFSASTYKILKQALCLAGMSAVDIEELWVQAHMESLSPGNLFNRYYDILISMTDADGRKPSRTGYPLFEGRGNWGTADGKSPAYPDFNSCRLNFVGEAFAKVVLKRNPDFKRRLLDLSAKH